MGMSTARSSSRDPLRGPDWDAINREEADDLRARNMALSPAERLELGQKLSQQAMSLLTASVRAGHAPKRALWS